MKLQRTTLLVILFCLALTPTLAEVARQNRSRDGGPGLVRLQRMGSRGPIARETPTASRVGGVTRYVAPPPLGSNLNDGLTPTTPYETIDFAFRRANSGDEIRVLPGSYNECINNTAFYLGVQKNLSVIADDWVVNGNKNSTVIDGAGACPAPFSVVNLAGAGSPGSRLEGFTITNAADSGVFLLGSGIVTENVIVNNTGLDGGGVFVYPGTCYYGEAAVEISRNTIINNTADDMGLCTPGGEQCTLDAHCGTGAICEIFGGNGGGLYIRAKAVNFSGGGCTGGNSRVTVTENTIDGNEADFAFGAGMYAKTDAETGRSSIVTITSNLISNNVTLPFSLGYGGGAWMGTFGYGTERIHFNDNVVSTNATTGDGGGISAWVDTKSAGNHSIEINRNIVERNTAEGAGGGMDLFQISRGVVSGDSVLAVGDNEITDNDSLATNLATFSPGVGGGAVINAWSEETLLATSGITFSGNEVRGNTATVAGGGVGIIVRADADHDDDGMTADASSRATFDHNLVVENTATDGAAGTTAVGGGVFAFAHGEGGATFPATSTILMQYNTVAKNTADTGSGGIEIESYTITDENDADADTAIDVSNSIIYDNSRYGVGGPALGGLPLISVPDWDGRPATGNLTLTTSLNFVFMNPAGGYESPLLQTTANDPIVLDPLLNSAYLPVQCSPTIDAGIVADPGDEPDPNGGAYNLGHTGGTAEATKSLADATGDGYVDGVDVLRLAVAFATVSGDGRFDASVDFDNDGFVGPIDLVLLAVNFAQNCQ